MRLFSFFLLPILVCLLNVTCRNNAANNASTSKTANASQQANRNATSAANDQSNQTNAYPPRQIPIYTYEVVKTYKHDSKAFTEGLTFYNNFLYESTGSPDYNGNSSLRKIDLASGQMQQNYKLDPKYFGEGLTILNGKAYQLTWNEKTCFVYDVETFKLLTTFAFTGEGWGLTNDGTSLIMSDGSHIIRFIDPNTFQVVRTINVFNNNKPLTNINELEFIKDEIWANIWHSEDANTLGKPNYIVRLDPKDGKILGWIDLAGISPDDVDRGPENTLNGIAYDSSGDRIFVTGKQWKKLFEIKIKAKTSAS